MESEKNTEIIEHEKNSILSRVIVYGVFVGFVSSMIMCGISLVLLVRTYNLANRVLQKDEELNRRYEAYEQRIMEVEESISASEENIDKNTAILTATIEGQTEFVSELYKTMMNNSTVVDSHTISDLDKTTQDGNSTVVGNTSKQADPLNEMLDIELDILMKMLKKLSEFSE